VSTDADGLGWPGQPDREAGAPGGADGSAGVGADLPPGPGRPGPGERFAALGLGPEPAAGEQGEPAGSLGVHLGWPAAHVSPESGAVDQGRGRVGGDAPGRPAGDLTLDTPIARAARAALAARSGGPAWPRPGSCRIITIANQKGGVGKTTTAVNIAASMALHGLRVLVIDLDPQGNASTALDVDHHSGTVSVYNVLVDGQPLSAVVKPAAGISQLYCAPATIDLAGAEIELVPLVARESRLVRALGGFDTSGLDYIFIDCPPSLGLLTVNALVAAPEVLIPIQCEYYALEGLEQLLRTVDLVKSHLNPGLAVSTILLTMFDGRTRLASQVADEVRDHFGEIVLATIIPRSVRVSEAPSYGQSVITYDPGSSGAQAYLEAAREMAHRTAPRA
jgi:chromosome partitioning protein